MFLRLSVVRARPAGCRPSKGRASEAAKRGRGGTSYAVLVNRSWMGGVLVTPIDAPGIGRPRAKASQPASQTASAHTPAGKQVSNHSSKQSHTQTRIHKQTCTQPPMHLFPSLHSARRQSLSVRDCWLAPTSARKDLPAGAKRTKYPSCMLAVFTTHCTTVHEHIALCIACRAKRLCCAADLRTVRVQWRRERREGQVVWVF